MGDIFTAPTASLRSVFRTGGGGIGVFIGGGGTLFTAGGTWAPIASLRCSGGDCMTGAVIGGGAITAPTASLRSSPC